MKIFRLSFPAALLISLALYGCSSVAGSYYTREGIRRFEKAGCEKALPLLEKAVEKDPEGVDALYHLGLCYDENKKYDEALSMYRKVINLDPHHNRARARLADDYYRSGLYPLAEREYQILVSDNPNDTHALFRLGHLAYRQELYEEAALYFMRVLELEPEEERAYFNLGVIFGYDLENEEKADEYFIEYLARVPSGERADQARAWLEGTDIPALEEVE